MERSVQKCAELMNAECHACDRDKGREPELTEGCLDRWRRVGSGGMEDQKRGIEFYIEEPIQTVNS